MEDNNEIVTITDAEIIEAPSLTPDLNQLAAMLAGGHTVRSAALELGKSESWVRLHKKDPGVLTIIKEIQSEALDAAKTTIVTGTSKAAQKMITLLDSPMPGIQFSAAKDLLDRMGLKAPDRKEINKHVTLDLPPEERKKKIKDLIERLESDE